MDLICFKEQDTVGGLRCQVGHHPLAVPHQHTLAVVVTGKTFKTQFLHEALKAMVGLASPLAAQINHGACSCCLANHSPARSGSGLEKMNLQSIFAKLTSGCQARQSCSDHHYIHVRWSR